MWYRKAAEQGDTYGQMNLGSAYDMGDGVPKDQVLAYMWLNLSAAAGNELSRGELRDLEREMSKSQIQEAQRLTREWRRSR
jgi:TPR repeat protein